MIERSFAFGEGAGLVGTVCLPDASAAQAGGVGQVLFNAGMVHRVGPHRINVRLARALAARGIPSIRFDLAGQGDSARAPGPRSSEEQAVVDLSSAMDALAGAASVARFALFGFCSGGVHSYAAAQADPRIAGILLYDTYFYPTTWSRLNRYLLPIRETGLVSSLRRWMRRQVAKLPQPWRAGDASALAQAQGLFPTPTKHAFARTVRALHERGTQVGVIYSGSFRELYNYGGQFRDAFAAHGIAELVSVDFLPATTHSDPRPEALVALLQRVENWTARLDARVREGAAKP